MVLVCILRIVLEVFKGRRIIVENFGSRSIGCTGVGRSNLGGWGSFEKRSCGYLGFKFRG